MNTRRIAVSATAVATAAFLIGVGVANGILPILPGPDPTPVVTVTPTQPTITPTDRPWTVDRTIDGDTIIVWQGTLTVITRLIGIDTPESAGKYKTHPQCYGKEASAYAARQLAANEQVTLTYGPRRLDRYGRTLAYVRDGDGDYGQRAIRMGYARQYRETRAGKRVVPNHPNRVAYTEAERLAQQAHRGLWAACEATP
jgi:endonuclease YncB( thermonuclease family)